jgi:hypothetical protein
MKRMKNGKLFRMLPHAVKYSFLSIFQRISLGVPLGYVFKPLGSLPFPKRRQTFIHFFKYINYDYEKQITLIKNVLDWKHPTNRVSRFDCLLYCFGNYHALRLTTISADGGYLL